MDNASPYYNQVGEFVLACQPARRCIEDVIFRGVVNMRADIAAANGVGSPVPTPSTTGPRRARLSPPGAGRCARRSAIVPACRYGEWDSYNSEHALIACRRVADFAFTRDASQIGNDEGACFVPATP